MEIDTLNRFGVTSYRGQVVVQIQPTRLTSKEAIELAAWLVAIADVNASCMTGNDVTDTEKAISADAAAVFAKALDAVRNT